MLENPANSCLVPLPSDLLVKVATDPEATQSSVSVVRKRASEPQDRVVDYRRSLVQQLVERMMNERFDEITRKPDAPFLSAGAFGGSLAPPVSTFTLAAGVQEGKVESGLAALEIEAKRVREYGFGPAELDRAKKWTLAGYERALKDHGLAIRPSLVRSGSFHREHAIEDATALIRSKPAPTAIFAANNILAEATLIALDQQGLKVPRDVSVVAFDDVQWMDMVEPPLTAVRQPVADMARSAAELALRRLRDGFEGRPSTVVFRTELVERGSVAPMRKNGRAARAASAR